MLTRRSLSVIMVYDQPLIDPQHVYKNVLYNVSTRKIIINKNYFKHKKKTEKDFTILL